MINVYKTLEFDVIIDQLKNYCLTEQAKENFDNLTPYLSETEVIAALRETSEARKILDNMGNPPLVSMKDVDKFLITAKQGGMLLPEQLDYMGIVLTSIRRMKDFLNRSKILEISLPYYEENLNSLDELKEEIQRCIRSNQVDDYATTELRDIRRSITNLEEKIKSKAEGMLKNNKNYFSESFIANRNGHICLPVKKEYKLKVPGSVIDKSSTGATLFIEPTSISVMNAELALLKLDEENEVRKILYTLTGLIADNHEIFAENVRVISKLDFIFAKGKLSVDLCAVAPAINTVRYLNIVNGRHPLMNRDTCVPLNISMGGDSNIQGIIITGPNTGGKTVAIKTVGLLSIMAQSGLHIPCDKADICMNSQILCDIGDGQNITENLSTFSAHITNILDILKKVNKESLVILDELGSGTDPTEGMGIAIALLDELKNSGCLFLVTTHYPEVKQYTEQEDGIINARMTFDRETLQPLYQLELGKAGESCALYIAKRLGMPCRIIKRACDQAYGDKAISELGLIYENENIIEKPASRKEYSGPRIKKASDYIPSKASKRAESFQIGDSVLVYPEKKIGIVCRTSDENGELLVQMKKEKILINHKRLQLYIPVSELYPEDYDFSIIFDTVANRKARHKMGKRHQPDLEIKIDEP